MLWIEFGRIIWCSFHCSVIWMESVLVMDQKLLSLSLSNWSNDKMLAGIQIKHNVSVIYLYKQGQAGIQLGSTLSLWYGTRVHVRHFTIVKRFDVVKYRVKWREAFWLMEEYLIWEIIIRYVCWFCRIISKVYQYLYHLFGMTFVINIDWLTQLLLTETLEFQEMLRAWCNDVW